LAGPELGLKGIAQKRPLFDQIQRPNRAFFSLESPRYQITDHMASLLPACDQPRQRAQSTYVTARRKLAECPWSCAQAHGRIRGSGRVWRAGRSRRQDSAHYEAIGGAE